MKAFNLRNLNILLGVIIVMLATYIIIWPFLPNFSWWIKHSAPVISKPVITKVSAEDEIPKDNTLVIPKLAMREIVHEGQDISALRKGVWRIPSSSTPDNGGNTILAGHRFTYDGQAVFYNLDKVSAGDNITVYWQGKRYDYKVKMINEVPPTDENLIAPTNDPTLTIYTCTPLWSAKNRLVITAELTEGRP